MKPNHEVDSLQQNSLPRGDLEGSTFNHHNDRLFKHPLSYLELKLGMTRPLNPYIASITQRYYHNVNATQPNRKPLLSYLQLAPN